MPKSNRLAFIEPAQPVLADAPPGGAGWIHEIKQDGFRTQLVIQDGAARAYSRSGLDWSDRYRPIVSAAAALPVKSAIIDGEMIVTDANGRSDFHRLASAISKTPDQLVLVAFDLLWLDGEDLRGRPLVERRAKLEALLVRAGDPCLVFSRSFEGDGADVFKAAENLGLEGIISKRADGVYRSGTRSGWQKAKCTELGTFEVIGVDRTPGGAPVALLSAGDQYVGQAMIGLESKVREAFWRFVDVSKADRPAIRGLGKKRGATWITGGLQARVKHLRGEPGMLRHASVVEIVVPRASASRQTKPVASTRRSAAPRQL